jgi:ribonuclease PH
MESVAAERIAAPERPNGRAVLETRPVRFTPNFTRNADGSVLVEFGGTRVICTASVDENVPRWMADSGLGWVTAEYSMMPASTGQRSRRDSRSGKTDGRTVEIQRLIGRSLRAVVDRAALGTRTITVDCDVLDADGGTRCAAICGGWVALKLATDRLVAAGTIERSPLTDVVSAVSVGIVGGELRVDLEYVEDSVADVDMNLVVTGAGQLVEAQASAEGDTFTRSQLDAMLNAATAACERVATLQHEAAAAGLAERGA